MNYLFTNNLIKNMGSKKNKIIYLDDEEHVWCSHEQEYVIYSEFETNQFGEYRQFCMKCADKIYSQRNMNYTHGAQERAQYIEEQAKIMLTNLGYDVNSEFSIHEQFLIKHNLR